LLFEFSIAETAFERLHHPDEARRVGRYDDVELPVTVMMNRRKPGSDKPILFEGRRGLAGISNIVQFRDELAVALAQLDDASDASRKLQ
jgi:hypothetical protein